MTSKYFSIRRIRLIFILSLIFIIITLSSFTLTNNKHNKMGNLSLDNEKINNSEDSSFSSNNETEQKKEQGPLDKIMNKINSVIKLNQDNSTQSGKIEFTNEKFKPYSSFDENGNPIKPANPEFKVFHRGSNYRDKDDPNGESCPISWAWTYEKEESDLIILNVLDNYSDINHIERYDYDKSRQKICMMSMESTSNYKIILKNQKYFDYTIDYRLDSDVPIPYSYDFFNFSIPALPVEEKGKDGRGLAVAFISNCFSKNDRLDYLEELSKYIQVDSYGSCLNNKNVYDEDRGSTAWETKVNTIKKYKFVLAFENSNDHDYVTEKFFQPLEIGSVPIFYGTKNVYDFAPTHSYIHVNDFSSMEELANYLKYLDSHDEEYNKYLNWKTSGDWGEKFNRVIEIRKMNSICQLLQRIRGLWINPYLKEWKRNDRPDSERGCQLC